MEIQKWKVLKYIRSNQNVSMLDIAKHFEVEQKEVEPILETLSAEGKIHKESMYYTR